MFPRHTPFRRNRRRRAWLIATTLVAAAALSAGCGGAAPIQTPGAEVTGGAVGPDTPVSSDVKVLSVHIAYPNDGVYQVGENASLTMAISNTGTNADTLTNVTGPDFAGVRSSNADDGDTLAIDIPANDNVYIGSNGEPGLTLVHLDRSLRSSQSIPVTFVFARAGEVTVDAVVAAEGQTPGAAATTAPSAAQPTT